VLRDGRGI